MGLKLRHADFSTINRQRTLPRPSNRDQDLWQAVEQLLQTELRRWRGPVRLIGMRTAGLSPAATQFDMLDAAVEKETRLESAVDLIREKFGFDAVRTGRTLGRHGEPGGEAR